MFVSVAKRRTQSWAGHRPDRAQPSQPTSTAKPRRLISFNLGPLLISTSLFSGQSERFSVVSKSSSSLSFVFCFPHHFCFPCPTWGVGAQEGEAAPCSDMRGCWQISHRGGVDLMSKCTEGWGSRLLIVREGSYTRRKGESGGAWWCWPGTGGLGVTWRGRDSRQALLASSTPGARILASPHGSLLEEPGSSESWQNPRLGRGEAEGEARASHWARNRTPLRGLWGPASDTEANWEGPPWAKPGNTKRRNIKVTDCEFKRNPCR